MSFKLFPQLGKIQEGSIIDLDLKLNEKIPMNVNYDLDKKSQEKLENNCIKKQQRLNLFMTKYVTMLNEQGNRFVYETFLKGLNSDLGLFHDCFIELPKNIANENYLNNMSNILLIYCDIEMKLIHEKEKKLDDGDPITIEQFPSFKMSKLERIIYFLQKHLLNHNTSMIHVLMKMHNYFESQSCNQIFIHLFKKFTVDKPPENLSPESFFRYYIIFTKWKLMEVEENWPKLDNLLYTLFKRKKGYIKKCKELKKNLHPQFNAMYNIDTNKANLVRLVNKYFEYIKNKRQKGNYKSNDKIITTTTTGSNASCNMHIELLKNLTENYMKDNIMFLNFKLYCAIVESSSIAKTNSNSVKKQCNITELTDTPQTSYVTFLRNETDDINKNTTLMNTTITSPEIELTETTSDFPVNEQLVNMQSNNNNNDEDDINDELDVETDLTSKKLKLSINHNLNDLSLLKKEEEISYPARPMISIAEVLEEQKYFRELVKSRERQTISTNPVTVNSPTPNTSGQVRNVTEHHVIPPRTSLYNLVPHQVTPIVTDQFDTNSYTYNNATINYYGTHPHITIEYPNTYSMSQYRFTTPNYEEQLEQQSLEFERLRNSLSASISTAFASASTTTQTTTTTTTTTITRKRRHQH